MCVHDSITLCVRYVLSRIFFSLQYVSIASKSNSVLLLRRMMKMFIFCQFIAEFVLIRIWNCRSIFLLVWKVCSCTYWGQAWKSNVFLIKWSVSSEAIKFINEIQTTWLRNRLLHWAAYACANKSNAKNDAKRRLNLQSVGNWDALYFLESDVKPTAIIFKIWYARHKIIS